MANGSEPSIERKNEITRRTKKRGGGYNKGRKERMDTDTGIERKRKDIKKRNKV